MSRTWKSILALLLIFAMVLSLGTVGFALDDEPEAEAPAEEPANAPEEDSAEESDEGAGGTVVSLPFEKVDNDSISARFPMEDKAIEEAEPLFADDEIVRVSIVLRSPSAINAGYAPASAGAYRNTLRAEQQTMAQRISANALGGEPLNVVWNLTLAGNIISAYVEYGQIEAIRNTIGVQDVFLETLYFPEEDEVNNDIATQMTGATRAWNLGFTGAGSKIAIVDTGLGIDHLSFDPDAFQEAIDELNEGRETRISLMTADDTAAVWDDLNASSFVASAADTYRNAKVPYAVNYVDLDLDITHANDDQGEHGSHVAGIAAANKYIPSGDGYVNALEAVGTQGEAPDAQLLIMKVFGKGGGAYDSDYMAAIEDALVLGCDSVNLSLGSSSAGFTTNSTYADLLDALTYYGLVWCNSAGNSYSWTQPFTGSGTLLADDVNYHTGGSPGTYHNALTVASVDDTSGTLGLPLQMSDGSSLLFSETLGYGNASISSLSGTYSYIMLLPDYAGAEEACFTALGPDILDGKIAVTWRGESTFSEKANAGAAMGAAATIIANNRPGEIGGMNLSDYRYTEPVIGILENDGYNLMYSAYYAGGLKEANGVSYVEGTIIIPEGVGTTIVSEFQQMSDFSSWGGNGALTMKPEITAPGGNIWSVNGMTNDGYEYMSGTSMASPQVAGLIAVLKQYIRETGLASELGMTERAVAQSLLMSTAIPLREAATGNYWSILKQGAGLANASDAISARSLIRVTGLPATAPVSARSSIADGKVKIEVGQVYNGFSAEFAVTNFSDEAMSLYLSGEFFTQWISGGFRTEYTTPISAGITWTVDGQPYTPNDLSLDFNNDGFANAADAQTLLDWCADDSTEIYKLQNADLDNDGNVDTNDAKLAFERLNGAALTLAAGETSEITATVSYDMSAYDAVNGNYLEGFLFVQEGETNDGALGVKHSIPVYGYNGSFSNASMFDRGSVLEYTYGFGDGDPNYGAVPYLYGVLGSAAVETFLVTYPGYSGKYAFGGNPVISDQAYHPERNALNTSTVLAGVSFSQIRNSGASRFFLTDQDDNIVQGTEMRGGSGSAAYSYISNGQVQYSNTATTINLNFIPRNLPEDLQLTAHYQLALEYYASADGSIRWDDLGKGSELTIPFVIDNTAPEITAVTRRTIEASEGADASDTLEISASDNQYIAAVILWTDEDELLDKQGSVETARAGDALTYSFDLQDIFKGEEVYPYLLVEVYDYAMNLSIYKINYLDDLETAQVESVTVLPASTVIMGTGSVQLSVDVRPWGIDDTVIWESDDESIATVDQTGLVTGVSAGTTAIFATSALNEEVYGYSVVTVKFVDKELNAVVWDEEGKVWFSGFNLNSLPAYQQLAPASARFVSLAYDDDMVLWGATLDTGDGSSELYTIDPDNWSAEKVGDSQYGFMDMCQEISLGGNYLYAVYGPYVLIVEKASGGLLTAFNLADYIDGTELVGIAYEEQYNHPTYGYTDLVFLVDNAGSVYETGFLVSDGSIARFGVYNVARTNYAIDMWYFQSLYYDGSSLYWSRFNEADNKVDIIWFDLSDTRGIYNMGSFADEVWPVGGLFELGKNPAFSSASAGTDYSSRVKEENAVFFDSIAEPGESSDTEPEYEDSVGEIEPIYEPSGSLNAVQVAAEQPNEDEIVIEITADEPMNNGKITVEFDPDSATLISAVTAAQYKGVLDQAAERGKYVLAWVDLDGIAAGDTILTLVFTKTSTGTVLVTTSEENEKDSADAALPREELIDLTTGEPLEECEHSYQVTWVWSEDYSSAYAEFTCTECGAAKTLDAVVEAVLGKPSCTEPVTNVYTAVVELDGEPYTDVKEVVIQPEGHSYKRPVWLWTETEEGFSATARFSCSKCGHVELVEAAVTLEVIAPTCEEAGAYVYTASAEFEGYIYTEEKDVEIPALGHDWVAYGDWSYFDTYGLVILYLRCANCGQWYDELYETEPFVVEPTCEITEEGLVYTASVEVDGEVYSVQMTVPAGAIYYGKTLNTGVKFCATAYFRLSDEVLEDTGAYAIVSGTTNGSQKIMVSDATMTSDNGNVVYGFEYNLAPKTFNDPITVQFFTGDDEEIITIAQLDGEWKYLPDGYTYTGQDYIDTQLAGLSPDTDAKLIALLKALSDFAYYTQVYFNYNTEHLGTLYPEAFDVLDPADYAAYDAVKLYYPPDAPLLNVISTSMTLKTDLKIRQYYQLAAGVDVNDLEFYYNGSLVTPLQRNSTTYYIETPNVPAKYFDVMNSFVIKSKTTGEIVYEGQFSALSYVYGAMNKYPSDENLMNLVYAMAAYGAAAKAYWLPEG